MTASTNTLGSRIGRFAAFARVCLSLGQMVGCGPFGYLKKVAVDASRAVGQAEKAGAKQYAPYEYLGRRSRISSIEGVDGRQRVRPRLRTMAIARSSSPKRRRRRPRAASPARCARPRADKAKKDEKTEAGKAKAAGSVDATSVVTSEASARDVGVCLLPAVLCLGFGCPAASARSCTARVGARRPSCIARSVTAASDQLRAGKESDRGGEHQVRAGGQTLGEYFRAKNTPTRSVQHRARAQVTDPSAVATRRPAASGQGRRRLRRPPRISAPTIPRTSTASRTTTDAPTRTTTRTRSRTRPSS